MRCGVFAYHRIGAGQEGLQECGEHDPHAIEKVHDGRSRLAHVRHHGLVRQEIAAVDGIVNVLPNRIAFTFGVEHRIDAALCAD